MSRKWFRKFFSFNFFQVTFFQENVFFLFSLTVLTYLYSLLVPSTLIYKKNGKIFAHVSTCFVKKTTKVTRFLNNFQRKRSPFLWHLRYVNDCWICFKFDDKKITNLEIEEKHWFCSFPKKNCCKYKLIACYVAHRGRNQF